MDLVLSVLVLLLIPLGAVIYGRLFWRVYAHGAGKVFIGAYSLLDGVFAGGLILIVIIGIFANADPDRVSLPANIDTRALLFSQLYFWGLILGTILFSLRLRGFRLSTVFGIDQLPVRQSILSGVSLLICALPLIFAASYLASYFLHTDPTTDTQEIIQVFERSSAMGQRLPIILLAVVIAPVAEELAFRGYLYGVMRRYFGALPALVFTGVLFAIVHLNVPTLLPLFILSCLFTVSYEATGSLLVPMTMHALFNTVNLVAIVFQTK
jgi:membrane protease YdiL (CAAX protease family)